MSTSVETFIIAVGSYDEGEGEHVNRLGVLPVDGSDVMYFAVYTPDDPDREITKLLGVNKGRYVFATKSYNLERPYNERTIYGFAMYDPDTEVWADLITDARAFAIGAYPLVEAYGYVRYSSSGMLTSLSDDNNLWISVDGTSYQPPPRDRYTTQVTLEIDVDTLAVSIISNHDSYMGRWKRPVFITDRWIVYNGVVTSRATTDEDYLNTNSGAGAFVDISGDGETVFEYTGYETDIEVGVYANYETDSEVGVYAHSIESLSKTQLLHGEYPQSWISGSGSAGISVSGDGTVIAMLVAGLPSPEQIGDGYIQDRVIPILKIVNINNTSLLELPAEYEAKLNRNGRHVLSLNYIEGPEVCEDIYDEYWGDWNTECRSAIDGAFLISDLEAGTTTELPLRLYDTNSIRILGTGLPIQAAGSFWTSFKNTEEII